MINQPRTLLDKVWDSHIVKQDKNSPAILYIDLHLVHEVTSPQAFDELRTRKISVHNVQRTFATIDHAVPTRLPKEGKRDRMFFADVLAKQQVDKLIENCRDFGVTLFDLEHINQGIVHVIGPELGLTTPGSTIVCGDSHTATHGAFGCLAFGIGTSEVGHVLASQCLLQHKPKSFKINITGKMGIGVTAKDLILAIINKIGVNGGVGHVFEYTGSVISDLSMESRMTICNMSIEAGARAGMIAPDEITIKYLEGKQFSPKRDELKKAASRWLSLKSDEGAIYDREVSFDITSLEPMITYGTNPAMAMSISGYIPDKDSLPDESQREVFQKSLAYMGFKSGEKMLGKNIDVVFIGSCTNSRISDLREAASILKLGKVNDKTQVIIVPGSQRVKNQAEAEGLDRIFLKAGSEWREPGCSMCIGMNGDQLLPGQLAISTSNRNFEGRQGKLSKTILASPIVAAASALTGQITDPRKYLE